MVPDQTVTLVLGQLIASLAIIGFWLWDTRRGHVSEKFTKVERELDELQREQDRRFGKINSDIEHLQDDFDDIRAEHAEDIDNVQESQNTITIILRAIARKAPWVDNETVNDKLDNSEFVPGDIIEDDSDELTEVSGDRGRWASQDDAGGED